MSTALSRDKLYEQLFTLINTYPNKDHSNYTEVSKYNDPVLQNIALSLAENFKNSIVRYNFD